MLPIRTRAWLPPTLNPHRLPQGLARLLELMSDWFNLTLGDKLLDHLKNWLAPEKQLTGQVRAGAWHRAGRPLRLPAGVDAQGAVPGADSGLPRLVQRSAHTPCALRCANPLRCTTPHALQFMWKPGEEALVASLVLDLFHLLPRAAVKFLETHQGPAPAAAAAGAATPGSGVAAGGATPAGDKPAAAGAGGPADPSASTKLGLVILTIQLEEKLTALNSPVGWWTTRERTACRARWTVAAVQL